MISLLITCGFQSYAQGDGSAVHTVNPTLQEDLIFLNPEYLVYRHESPADEKLPLVIYLHGAGGRGENISKIRGQVRALWAGVQQFDKAPCIVVAPQVLKTSTGERMSTWESADLNLLLEDLKAKLPIDEKRVYLTGNSMGGYGSWMWGASNPEHFAAIAPLSGGIGRGGPKDVTPELIAWAKKLSQVPVYAFAGADDRVVPPERSERLIEAIKKAGGNNAQLKVYPDEGHGAGRVALSSEEFYDWMFSKVRD